MRRARPCFLASVLLVLAPCVVTAEPNPAALETSPTPIDGDWRLARIHETRIPALAARLVYTFEKGRGSLVKNGKPSGDGFDYTAASGRIRLSGAEQEALLDTMPGRDRYDHYNFTLSGGVMEWWVPDPFSPDEKKTVYVFERV